MASKQTSNQTDAGPRRIAVLLTNNDESEFSRQFPSDAEKVCTLLRIQRPDWTYRAYSVKDDIFPAVEEADGYVITGSPASVHDPLPWIAKLEVLIQGLHDQQIPLIGLCFGHQVIAKALGGLVARNPGGWRFGIEQTNYQVIAPWMRPCAGHVRLHACHAEQVFRLPPGAQLLGGNSFCPIASFAYGEHIFTTEYHPEFTREFMTSLADAYQGELPEKVLDAARKELQGEVDSDVFAQWVIHFFAHQRR